MVHVGIYGMGRLGRSLARYLIDLEGIGESIAISCADPNTLDKRQLAYALKYDTIHGVSNHDITYDETLDSVFIDARELYLYFGNRANFPVAQQGIELVVDCTGEAREQDLFDLIDAAGARQVLACNFVNNNIPLWTAEFNNRGSFIGSTSSQIFCIDPDSTVIYSIMKALLADVNISNYLETFSTTFIKSISNGNNIYDNVRLSTDPSDPYNLYRSAFNNVLNNTYTLKRFGLLIPALRGKGLPGNSIRVPSIDGNFVSIDVFFTNTVTNEDICTSLKNNLDPCYTNVIGDKITAKDAECFMVPIVVEPDIIAGNFGSGSYVRIPVYYQLENVIIRDIVSFIKEFAQTNFTTLPNYRKQLSK